MSKLNLVALAIVLVFTATLTQAQTSSFTYQGRFTDAGTPANGTYDMQFKLFDTPSVGAGNQIGATITNATVTVSGGIFTVQIDYGAAAFPGADRYLEIGLRLAGDANPYTVLSPRQQLTSAVYAIRAGSTTTADTATTATTATNATQLGGVAAGQYVQTSDSRLSDARVPAPGSSNYIQNSAAVQASANFNISGNGTAGGTLSANVVNAATQYDLNGNRVLSVAGTENTFTGVSAGSANTGSGNSFFGRSAGVLNTGSSNSFFGRSAGASNTTGGGNSFFGSFAGDSTTQGFSNSFFGQQAGDSNVLGDRNTVIGFRADVTSGNLVNATAIGAHAAVSQSNSLVLGAINGVNEALIDTNVGIGTTAPKARLHIAVNSGNILIGDAGCSSQLTGIGFGASLSGCTNYSLLGNGTDTILNRPTGGVISFRENNATQVAIAPGGAVSIATLGSAGSTSLCRNASNQISTCSSSLRYKKDLQPFTGGLLLLNQLKPITFKWKADNSADLGFGAEDIAAVEPLLVTRNDKGEVEGVKYDRITAVLVNAVKEQQEQIRQQQNQIASLSRLVCRRHTRALVCKR